jgi:flagellar basal body-associated protein FliL
MSIYTFIVLAFLLLTIFGCVSIFDAYASAKQSQVAIEASQAAQLALKAQILISIALIVIIFILLIAIFALLYKFFKKQVVTSKLPRLPENEFTQKEYPVLGDSGVQRALLICQEEKEEQKELTLPIDWGW